MQMVQARQNTWKYTRMTTDNESFTNLVQNTSSRNLHKLHNLQFLHSVAKLKWKRKHTTTLLHWFSSNTTGQTGATGPKQPPVRLVHWPVRPVETKLRAAHPALKCATCQIPNLRVSLHHFPPLCISADEFDAAGAEVNVRVSCNKNVCQQTRSN